MLKESRDDLVQIMKDNKGINSASIASATNDEDWGNSINDQDPGYWENLLGGPDDFEIAKQFENDFDQAIEEDFFDTEKTQIFDNYTPRLSKEDIKKFNNPKVVNPRLNLNDFFDDPEYERKMDSIPENIHEETPIPPNETIEKNKKGTTYSRITDFIKSAAIIFVIISFLVVGIADALGISLKTNILGRIIDWTVLLGASIYGVVGIILLIGGLLYVVFLLIQHASKMVSSDRERRKTAWKITGESMEGMGKTFWEALKIICILVGAVTLIGLLKP